MKKQTPKHMISKPTSGRSMRCAHNLAYKVNGRTPYYRIFLIPKNVALAKKLIKDGVSNYKISKILKCDHTSIIAFRERYGLGKSKRNGNRNPNNWKPKLITSLKVEYGLTMKEWDVMDLYYGISSQPNMSIVEIAIHYGDTQAAIRNFKKAAEDKIKKWQEDEARGFSTKRKIDRYDEEGSLINTGRNYRDYVKKDAERTKAIRDEAKKRATAVVRGLHAKQKVK